MSDPDPPVEPELDSLRELAISMQISIGYSLDWDTRHLELGVVIGVDVVPCSHVVVHVHVREAACWGRYGGAG